MAGRRRQRRARGRLRWRLISGLLVASMVSLAALAFASAASHPAPTAGAAGASGVASVDVAAAASHAINRFRTPVTPSAAPSNDPTAGPAMMAPRAAVPVAGAGSCGGDPAHLIDVNLTTQELTATSGGQVVFQTPITSGPPDLQTPQGCFSIFAKETNLTFYSPFPSGSPYWYAPMAVAYAMEFAQGRYGAIYLHTDPYEPDSAFGPGSETGPYESHGCVHVPIDVMTQLFPWAPIGTAVYVHD